MIALFQNVPRLVPGVIDFLDRSREAKIFVCASGEPEANSTVARKAWVNCRHLK